MSFKDELCGGAAAKELVGSFSSGAADAFALAVSSGTTSSVALAYACGGDEGAISLA